MQRFFALAAIAIVSASCQSSQGPGPVGGSADETPFFVGRWAAAETACGHEAWTFTRTGLETPGEVACTFNDVRRVTAGYEISATCVAQAPPTEETIRLSYAESARAMLVEGGPFMPVGLISCPATAPVVAAQ